MLRTLQLTNFTVFSDASFRFCSGLNIVLGQNGTGKTMLLKAGYSMNRAWPDLMLKRAPLSQKRAEAYFEERLLGLFKPTFLNDLIRHGFSGEARLCADVDAFIPTMVMNSNADQQALKQFPFGSLTEPLHWEAKLTPETDVAEVKTNANINASHFPDTAPVNAYVPKSLFIPSKEIASLYEGLIALLDRYEIKLDDTYRDLARSMSSPELLHVPALTISTLADLDAELGGKLTLGPGGKLIFAGADGSETEAPLMAEGFRKLTTLMYLIRRGAMTEQGETLFWDEPDANLNPVYIRWVAIALHCLAEEGIQVIIATHSLFLARELEILVANSARDDKRVETQFFGLHKAPGNGVAVLQGESIDDIGNIDALDANLQQSDRYLAMET